MGYLVDSSVWIDFLRNRATAPAARLASVFEGDPQSVIGCPPVRMELGLTSDESARHRILGLYDRLDDAGIEAGDFETAAEIYRTVRLRGHTIRSLIDCLIAAVAERHGATLAHADVDFDRIAAVRPGLQAESWL